MKDNLQEIVDHTNFQGIPIENINNKKFDYLQESKIYIIGDSFIQGGGIRYNVIDLGWIKGR